MLAIDYLKLLDFEQKRILMSKFQKKDGEVLRDKDQFYMQCEEKIN